MSKLNGEAVTTEAERTLDFVDGRTTGKAFCNGFGRPYEREGPALTFGELAQTLIARLEPQGVMAFKPAYMAPLNSAGSRRMDAGKLVLVDAEGRDVVVLRPAETAGLDGTALRGRSGL